MSKLRFVFCLWMGLFGCSAFGQIILQPQLPSQGIVQQAQLWNLIVINNDANPVYATLKVSCQDEKTGSKLFAGTSGQLLIPKGAGQYTSSNIGAVHYDYFSGGPTAAGMLPVGQYIICYELDLSADKSGVAPAPECLPTTVEPFSPPELIFPENKSVQTTTYPVLNWLPPMPVTMFSNLNYKLIISEVFDGQSPEIAIQRNPLLFVQDQIKPTSLVYPSSYVALKPGKTYAWQIIAQNGATYAQATEVWSFSIQKDSVLVSLDAPSYPHMQRGVSSTLYSASELIKFSYENESGDSVVNLQIIPENNGSRSPIAVRRVQVKPGINFIDLDLVSVKQLHPQEIYIVQLMNGRKENWDLHFRYEPTK